MAYHKDMIAAPSRQTEPSLPPVISAQEWQAKLGELARQEKEAATTARQTLAAARRRMPMTLVEKDYRFLGPKGKMSLPDLFAGRRQLVLYRFSTRATVARRKRRAFPSAPRPTQSDQPSAPRYARARQKAAAATQP